MHLVTIEQVRTAQEDGRIEGITTVSLEDLIEMKLRSGSSISSGPRIWPTSSA